ncbi:hypothetical protein CB0940_11446 [Cercospora beticola]|uniref:Uncharacterized protein n=1 Tax=Cercospora beticola TaxID=122368 RepID=A0A2G5HCS5_CERBT|nr:hypothetical protein CB0940_11446 [Cercospora beticola]PIA90366.1 hypothetical protein CB0940_11446 [Cercospora beticola]WPB08301.1 hypothetical protein RHO25_012967 [Cercospora beticola]
MSTQRSIPPIPGLPYDRTFSNDADLVDEVADQIVPISAGRIIKKSYLGIVTGINNQSFEVNILETRGGKGFEGLPEEDRRYYWHIMAEGSQHMMPNALADPGLSTSLDTDDPPETVFVRHRNMRENGILNLRSKKFLYSELVSLAPGWLTEESTVRLEDKLKKCYPLQKTKLIEAAGISQSEADNIRAMPAPGSSNSISGENSGEVAAHTNTGVSNSGNDSWPSDEMPSAPRVCPDFNEGSCKSAGSCPHGLEHLCSDCYREHPRCGGRLPLGVEIKRENEERRNSARGLRPSKSNKRKHSASRAYQDSRLHEARGGGNDQRPDAQRGPHGDLDNNRAQQAAYTRTSNGRSPIRDDRDDRDTQRTAHPQTANGRPFRANESRGRSERRSRSRDRNFEDDFEASSYRQWNDSRRQDSYHTQPRDYHREQSTNYHRREFSYAQTNYSDRDQPAYSSYQGSEYVESHRSYEQQSYGRGGYDPRRR